MTLPRKRPARGEHPASCAAFEPLEPRLLLSAGTDIWPETAKLLAGDRAGGEHFGSAVAVSGNMAVIAAGEDTAEGFDAGSAYVFEYAGGNWTQDQKLLPPELDPFDYFGASVGISGATVVVGAPEDDGLDGSVFGAGRAYIFDDGLGGWTQTTSITGDEVTLSDHFGLAVAVSGDVAVVGAPDSDDMTTNPVKFSAGAVYVFYRNEGGADNWGQIARLIPDDWANQANFGNAVAVDGDTTVVAAYWDGYDGLDQGPGAAYIFQRNEGGPDNWGQVAKLTASDGLDGDEFGYALAISGDNVVVGARKHTGSVDESGAAYIYGRDQGGVDNWGQVAKITAAEEGDKEWFGRSVGISGRVIVVGAGEDEDDDGADGFGAAYVFCASGATWAQVAKITPTPAEERDMLGQAVAVSGTTVIAGAHGADDGLLSDSGAAYIFSGIPYACVADVSGDGSADLVRRNDVGHWLVTTAIGTTGVWGAWSTNIVWWDIQPADINGDGNVDIIGRAADSGTWYAAVSSGAAFANQPMGIWATAVTWVDVAVADVNNDGNDDVVGRAADSGAWYAAVSNGAIFANQFMGLWSPAVTWVDVAVADVNNDGNDDVVGRVGDSGAWYAAVANGTTFTSQFMGIWSPTVTWTDVAVADVNNDGNDDVVGRVGDSGAWYAAVANGTTFTSQFMGIWSAAITWLDVQVCDFDGDGDGDVIGRISGSNAWYAALSNGTSYTNQFLGMWSTAIVWVNVTTGDLDGDNDADIIGRQHDADVWWAGISNGVSITNVLWT